MPQADELGKLLRIFRLIELLTSPPAKTTKQLAARLEVGRKSVERYYKLLERLGYYVDSDDKHRYFITVEKGGDDRVDHGEAAYLNDLLTELQDDSPMRSSLLLKINKQYRLLPTIQTLQRNAQYAKLKELQRAADTKRVVHLHNYVAGDGKISPLRRIAVTGFTERNDRVKAFDLDKQAEREFTLARIGLLEVTEEDLPGEYPFYPNDLFGWPGKSWYHVRLRLSPRAHQLLREEYPASLGALTPDKEGGAVADLRLRGWPGCGRFVLSLPREVEVLQGGDGEGFRDYLNGVSKTW